jgi:hypothetical protein
MVERGGREGEQVAWFMVYGLGFSWGREGEPTLALDTP